MEKAIATHSSALAWQIPWMEEPGRLRSLGSLGVRHDWMTSLSFFTFLHWRRKWQPTPVLLPGESQGWGSLVGCHLWGCRVGHDWSDLATEVAAEAEAARIIMIVKGYIKINYGAPLMAQWLWICLQRRGHQMNPWSGKIPHAAEHLGLCTTAKAMLLSTHAANTEPACCNCWHLHAQSLGSVTREAPAVRSCAANWRAAPSQHS